MRVCICMCMGDACVCLCVHVCTRVCCCVCLGTHVHVLCVCTGAHSCVYLHVHGCTRVHASAYASLCVPGCTCVYPCVRMGAHVCMHLCVHGCRHMRASVCAWVHVGVCIAAYTRVCAQGPTCVCAWVRAHVCMSMSVCICMCPSAHTRVLLCLHGCRCVCMSPCVHKCVCPWVHMSVLLGVHAYPHVCAWVHRCVCSCVCCAHRVCADVHTSAHPHTHTTCPSMCDVPWVVRAAAHTWCVCLRVCTGVCTSVCAHPPVCLSDSVCSSGCLFHACVCVVPVLGCARRLRVCMGVRGWSLPRVSMVGCGGPKGNMCLSVCVWGQIPTPAVPQDPPPLCAAGAGGGLSCNEGCQRPPTHPSCTGDPGVRLLASSSSANPLRPFPWRQQGTQASGLPTYGVGVCKGVLRSA